MKTKIKSIPKRYKKLLKGAGRKKGYGMTLTEGLTKNKGLTKGEGLAKTDPNISLLTQKPVKLKIKIKAAKGSRACPKGVGVALRGYGKAM